MNYSSYEQRSKRYIDSLVINANLGAIGAGIFFVTLNACILETLLVIDSGLTYATYYIATLSSAIPFGAIFGGLISSFFADKFGRRRTMIFADILTIFTCFLSVSYDPIIMMTGRVLCGVITGINFMVIPLYVREISPPTMTGRAGSYFRIFFTLGMLLTFVVALWLQNPATKTDQLWRVISALPCLFAFLRTVIFLLWIRMDTPRYYIQRGQETNVIIALQKIYRQDQVEQIYLKEKKYEKATFWDLFGFQYKRQTLLIILLIFATELTGSNTLDFYTSAIFYNKFDAVAYVDEINKVRMLNVVFALVRLMASFLGKYLIEKAGRRPLIIYGSLLTIFFALLIRSSESMSFLIGQQSLVILYTAVQSLTFALVLPIYAAELLPSFGIALQVSVQMLCVGVVTLTFPYVGLGNYFLLFSLVGVLTFLPIFKLAKETKSKTFYEVYRLFHIEGGGGLLDDEAEEDRNYLY